MFGLLVVFCNFSVMILPMTLFIWLAMLITLAALLVDISLFHVASFQYSDATIVKDGAALFFMWFAFFILLFGTASSTAAMVYRFRRWNF
jgi:hypothetical protein